MKLSLSILESLKGDRESFYIFFSAPSCGVCQVLSPKLKSLMNEQFPKLKAFAVDTSEQPEIAAQLGLFTNPSLLVYLEGNEFLRRSRVIGLSEVEEQLKRTYHLLFE